MGLFLHKDRYHKGSGIKRLNKGDSINLSNSLTLLFTQGIGTDFADLSGSSNHGTGTSTVWSIGKFGKTLRYDGSGAYTTVSNESSFDFNQQYFTVSLWFKSNLSTSGILASKGGSNNGGWSVTLNGTGTLSGAFKDTPGTTTHARVTVGLYNDNQWHHVVAVYYFDTVTSGNNSISLYIDGVLDTASLTGSGTAPALNNYPVRLGIREGSTGLITPYYGLIDNVRIWSRELRTDEIRRLYKEPFAGLVPTMGVGALTLDGLDALAAAAGLIKTRNGLAWASVKTVDGLAAASVKTINGLAAN